MSTLAGAYRCVFCVRHYVMEMSENDDRTWHDSRCGELADCQRLIALLAADALRGRACGIGCWWPWRQTVERRAVAGAQRSVRPINCCLLAIVTDWVLTVLSHNAGGTGTVRGTRRAASSQHKQFASKVARSPTPQDTWASKTEADRVLSALHHTVITVVVRPDWISCLSVHHVYPIIGSRAGRAWRLGLSRAYQ